MPSVEGSGLDTVGQRENHSLCGIDFNGDGHIGAPQDVSIDPHRPPDLPILCQPPQEIQGGSHSLKTLEVQLDTCGEEAEGLGNWLPMLRIEGTGRRDFLGQKEQVWCVWEGQEGVEGED